MKLKCRPEDFRVEELANLDRQPGPFALYRLTKTSIGTPEAIDAICRKWRLPRAAIGFGGLKDRHAVTKQFLTIHDGPRRNLRQTNLALDYLAQTAKPFESKDILANRFEIVLREIEPTDAARLIAVLEKVTEEGIPNYFDDQRFGSVGISGDFVARPWCLGDFERALWLALAESNAHDRPQVGDEKERLRDHWGNWAQCRECAARPVVRESMACLCRNPRDFRAAFVRIPQHERRMYLGAFQSFLWNRVLAETVRSLFGAGDLFEIDLARTRVPFYSSSPSEAAGEHLAGELPLPSSRERIDSPNLQSLYERVASEFGLEYRALRVKYPRDNFFSRGGRPAVFRPRSLSWTRSDDDAASVPRIEAKRKLQLRFELPRGAYATILVKRISEMP